tara:strand:- start:147 stop:257 length:111 start_codon:yes stop_codon:yes gene_type:complete
MVTLTFLLERAQAVKMAFLPNSGLTLGEAEHPEITF